MEARQYMVYEFNELPVEIQENSVEKLFNINVDHGWWEFVFEQFVEDAAANGVDVDIKKIWFSGFGFQGQGACFTGRLDAGKARAWIEKYMPTDKEYHRILFYLFENGFLSAWTSGKDRGYFQNSDIEFDNPHEEYVSWETPTDDSGRYQWSNSFPVGAQSEAYKRAARASDVFLTAWEEYCSDKAHELFKALEEEYDYLTSPEAIRETIEANGYMFDENGNID